MSGHAVPLLLAVALDLAAGEPADRWHPVAWIGRALARADAPGGERSTRTGALALLAVTAIVATLAAAVSSLTRRLGGVGVVIEAIALKPAFAIRALAAAASRVRAALAIEALTDARQTVGRDLVSRDPSRLTAGEVASAAVESVAENLTDSVASPLVAYAVGGLPAAWGYRALNTADAMWGYRTARYERFGKPAARLDDAANFVPARLAAAAVVLGAAAVGEDPVGATRVAWRHHGRTASPNAGWPMAAMAGALGRMLVKPGAYRLGDGTLPDGLTIGRALRVFAAAAAVLVGTGVGLTLVAERRR